MAKVQNQKVAEYKYFNKRPLPKTSQKLYDNLMLAYSTLNTLDKPYWGSISLMYENLKKTWGYSNEHFKRFWVDKLVEEFSYMLWNNVYNEGHTRDSEKKADQLSREFEGKFK